MPNEIKRIQVPLSKHYRDILKDLTTEYEKHIDKEIGVANVVAMLCQRVLDNPQLAHFLLYEVESLDSIVDDVDENGDTPLNMGLLAKTRALFLAKQVPKMGGRREAA